MTHGISFSPERLPVVFAAWGLWATVISIVIGIMLIGAAFIFLRALKNAAVPNEEADEGDMGLLGITRPLADVQAPTVLDQVVSMPAAIAPEPEPLIPVEIIPKVESAPLPVTEAVSGSFAESVTGEQEKVITDELPAIDTASVSQESLIAQQIAREIAERRARLSAPDDRAATRFVVPARHTGELVPPPPEPPPVEIPSATARIDSRTAQLPPKPVLTEQLPPSNRKLKPPTPSTREIPQSAPKVAVAAPVAFAQVAAARVETGDVSDRLLPVEQFPRITTPLTEAVGPRRPAQPMESVPAFLAEDGGIENIGYERRRLFIGMFVVLILFGVLYSIMNAAVRNKVYGPFAERLAVIPRAIGFEGTPPPPLPPKLVEIREYAVFYKPSEKKDVRIVVVSGIVKNIGPIKLEGLRAEIELTARQPGQPPELRTIFLAPQILEPGQEATYKLEVTDDKVIRTVVKRILASEKDAKGTEITRELKDDRKPGYTTSPDAPKEKEAETQKKSAADKAAEKRMQQAFPQPTDKESKPFNR